MNSPFCSVAKWIKNSSPWMRWLTRVLLIFYLITPQPYYIMIGAGDVPRETKCVKMWNLSNLCNLFLPQKLVSWERSFNGLWLVTPLMVTFNNAECSDEKDAYWDETIWKVTLPSLLWPLCPNEVAPLECSSCNQKWFPQQTNKSLTLAISAGNIKSRLHPSGEQG